MDETSLASLILNSVDHNNRQNKFKLQPVKSNLAQSTNDNALEEVKIELLLEPSIPKQKKENVKEVNDLPSDSEFHQLTEERLLEEYKCEEDAGEDTGKSMQLLLPV